MAVSKTSVTLDSALLEEARAYKVNITAACRAGLEEAVRDARRAAFKAENAGAIADHNRYVEEHGLPLEDHRMF